MSAIRVEDLRHRWPGADRDALAGVSLDIAAGERVALIGPNGAGKSTLLAYLNGALLADPPVRVGDLPVDRAHRAEIRRRVGVVLQETDDQLFMPTVAEDVAFGPLNAGWTRAEVERRVADALARVGAGALAERPHVALSGGERRRVAIATILSMDVEVMVLDEPSSNLDARGRRAVAEILRSLPQTVVVATHDLVLAREVCARAVLLDDGRVIADGPIGRILDDVALLESHGVW